MSGHQGFAVLLTRLLDHRELNVPDLTGTEDGKLGLQAVPGGAAPGLALVRWLAPALGMRVPDRYVIAGMEVPEVRRRRQSAPRIRGAGTGDLRAGYVNPETRLQASFAVRGPNIGEYLGGWKSSRDQLQ